MRVIYIDSLFFINLIVNYLLMLAVGKICALQVTRRRIFMGALLGAVYSVLTVLPGMLFLQNALIKVAVGLLMLVAVFGGQKGLLRIGLIFFAVAAAFGGIVMAVALLGGEVWTGGGIYLPISLRALLFSFGLSYGLLTLVFKFMVPRRGKGGYANVSIRQGEAEVSFLALKDTGNSVRDPVTGMSVPIVDSESLSALFLRDVSQILSNSKDKTAVEQMERLWQLDTKLRFRLIPYRSLGIKSEMLLAFKPDSVRVDGREMKGMWVAVSPTKVSESGVYSALVGGDV